MSLRSRWGELQRNESIWGWRAFEQVLRCRISTGVRRRIAKQCDPAIRDRILEALTLMMDGVERGHSSMIFTAYRSLDEPLFDVPVQTPMITIPVPQVATPTTAYSAPFLVGTVRGLPMWLPGVPWLYDYVSLMRSQASIPIAYLMLCGIAALSHALTNKLRIDAWGVQNTVNIFSLLIGPAGRSHKSTAIRQVRALIQEAQPGSWQVEGFSQQALEEELKGQPHGLVIQDEFHSFLTGGNQSFKDDARRFLMSLHSVDVYRTQYIKRGKVNINHPSVSLLGGMTPHQFFEDNDKGLFSDGLMSRLLTSWNLSLGQVVAPISDDRRMEVRSWLVRWLQNIAPAVDTLVMVDPEDMEELQTWAGRLNEAALQIGGAPLTERGLTYALRCGVLFWAAAERPRSRTYIPRCYLNMAMWFLEELYHITQENLEDRLAKTPDGRIMNNILIALREAGGEMYKDELLKLTELTEQKFMGYLGTLGKRKEVLWMDEETAIPGEERTLVKLVSPREDE